MEFILRDWQEGDCDSVAKYANNDKIAGNLRDVFPYPYSIEDAKWYVDSCIENRGKNQLCYAIIVDGEAVGSVGVFVGTDVYRKSAEIGYWLGEPFWNQGIMHRAVLQICNEAFECFDIMRIYGEPFSFNQGSCKVLEKAGFTYEGTKLKSVCKSDKIYDSRIYALVK